MIDLGDTSDYVYHYTGAAALIGILNKQEFWATHSKFLNDRYEGSLVDTRIAEIVAAPQHYYNADGKPDARSCAAVKKSLGNGWSSTVVSFSKHANSLTQFRMYAPTAGGYTIGFPKAFLAKFGELIECVYSDEVLTEWCLDYILRCANVVRSLSPDLSGTEVDIVLQRELLMERLRAGLRFKSDDFKNEAEVRLVNFGPILHVRASQNDSSIVPYNVIAIPDEPVRIIVSAGPNRDIDLRDLSVEHLRWLLVRSNKNWTVEYIAGNYEHAFRGG